MAFPRPRPNPRAHGSAESALHLKALRELAGLDLGLDEEDARDVLANLVTSEFSERIRSKSTGEWMYVFKPEVGGVRVYLKVILRTDCVVISFHDEEESHEDE